MILEPSTIILYHSEQPNASGTHVPRWLLFLYPKTVWNCIRIEERMIHMATAKKLPSGSWRIRVFDYQDINGKKHYKSFTCDDKSAKGKRKCELMAAEWAANKEAMLCNSISNITLQQCFDNYIASKENILSPATIRGYKQMYTYFSTIMDIKLTKINQKLVNHFVNDLSRTHSPKTVRNAHGFLSSALRASGCDINLNTKLPQAIQPVYTLPSDSDIKALTDYFSEHDKECLLLYISRHSAHYAALKSAD